MRLRTLGHWRLWPHGATAKGRNVSFPIFKGDSLHYPSTSPSTICYSLSLWMFSPFLQDLRVVSSSKRTVSPFLYIFGWLRIGKLFRAPRCKWSFGVPINDLKEKKSFTGVKFHPLEVELTLLVELLLFIGPFRVKKNTNFWQVKIWRFENEAPGWSWKRGFNSLISWGSCFKCFLGS